MPELDFNEPNILDDELRQVRAQIRRFVNQKIVPFGDAWEASGEIPRQLFRDLGALGFLGMRHPEAYGGGGLGALSSVILGEELSRSTYGGVASAITVHSDMSVSHIAHRGTHEQKERYLRPACLGEKIGVVCVTEAHAGSDVAGMKTRAVRTLEGWTINGSKMFITNAVYGDTYIVAARTDPEGRGSKGISLFIVERGNPGLKIARKLEKHGWRSSDTAELYLEDLKLPPDALLGEEGKGFYYIMSTFQNERLVIGALSSAPARKPLSSQWTTPGSARPLASRCGTSRWCATSCPGRRPKPLPCGR